MTVINERLALVESYLRILRSLESKITNVDEFAKNPIHRGAVERYLHLAVEALIDVGFRICSLIGLEKPDRYRDIAHILAEAEILSENNAKLLELWIGLRNLLVHAYAKINPAKTYEALKSINELQNIAYEIKNNVSKRKIDPPSQTLDIKKLIHTVRTVLEKHPYINFAYVFGSYATGKIGWKRDVDIAIHVNRKISWKEHVTLIHEIEDAVKKPVDLIILNEAPPILAYEIISKGKPILTRNNQLKTEVEVKIMHEYLDLKFKLKTYYKELFRKNKNKRQS